MNMRRIRNAQINRVGRISIPKVLISRDSVPRVSVLSMFKFKSQLNLSRSHRQKIFKFICLFLVFAMTATACSRGDQLKNSSPSSESSVNQKVLKVWWDKGFNPEEDEALRTLVSNWEKETGNQIQLLLYTTDSLAKKIRRSLQAGDPPDVVMSFKAERSPNSRLAWENKLVDVSDIIEPLKNLYPKPILETVNFYNNVKKKRSYYGIPIHQATMQIYYWRDLLEQVGRSEKDIPQEWDAFWEFWKKAQDDLRAQKSSEKSNIYSLGFTLSPEAGDTYYLFEQILEAYDVKIVSPTGELLIDKPETRQGIIKVLEWYKNFYQEGYIPPTALTWLNPGNNRSLLNREILMTPNSSLSIPVAVRQDPDIYHNKLGILEFFPNKPNGKPMEHLTMAEQATILADSTNQKLAKEFLRYVVKTEVLKTYLRTAGGRNSPVLKPVWEDPFWTNPKDPHISTATKTFTQGRVRYFQISQNPAYSKVLDENVWGKGLNKVIVKKISPEQAADECIKKIKQIFDDWEKS